MRKIIRSRLSKNWYTYSCLNPASAASKRVQTVTRALKILREFNQETPEWGISDLSRRLGLPKTIVFRLLETMRDEGFIEQNPDNKHYRLGIAIYAMAALYATSNDLIRIGNLILPDLVARTRFTAQLGVLDGHESVALVVVESPMIVRVSFRPGDRRLAYAGATGKVLLAGLTNRQVRSLFARRKMVSLTPKTIVDLDALIKQLEQIRRQGYAVNDGETTGGIMAVAAPVHDARRCTVAGLSLGWPSQLVPPEQISSLIDCVVEAAQNVSNRLGASEGQYHYRSDPER